MVRSCEMLRLYVLVSVCVLLYTGNHLYKFDTNGPVTDLHDFLSEASEEAKAPLLEAINRHLFEDDEDEGANEGSDEKSEGAHSKDTDKEVSRKGKEKDGEGKSNEGEENNKSKQEQSKEEFRFESIYEFLDCPIMRNLTVGGKLVLFPRLTLGFSHFVCSALLP